MITERTIQFLTKKDMRFICLGFDDIEGYTTNCIYLRSGREIPVEESYPEIQDLIIKKSDELKKKADLVLKNMMAKREERKKPIE